MTKKLDLTGNRYTRLTVLCFHSVNRHGKSMWTCQCECGTEKIVNGSHLKNGHIKSCGCLSTDVGRQTGKANKKHGKSLSPEYRSYTMMRHRCLNPENKQYKDYGGRGITICQRWLESFEAFINDMGPRPSGHSLDRIDVNGPYDPENCRWATRVQQARNTRTTKLETIDGITKSRAEWIDASKWERTTVYKRMKRGMAFADAIR